MTMVFKDLGRLEVLTKVKERRLKKLKTAQILVHPV
jgi:hypothetical protein